MLASMLVVKVKTTVGECEIWVLDSPHPRYWEEGEAETWPTHLLPLLIHRHMSQKEGLSLTAHGHQTWRPSSQRRWTRVLCWLSVLGSISPHVRGLNSTHTFIISQFLRAGVWPGLTGPSTRGSHMATIKQLGGLCFPLEFGVSL